MPKITFLLNNKTCTKKITVKAKKGESILDVALNNGINIKHNCDKSCVCATCHCIIKKGFSSIKKATTEELDTLDKAFNLESESRLSCQAIVSNEDLIIKIP